VPSSSDRWLKYCCQKANSRCRALADAHCHISVFIRRILINCLTFTLISATVLAADLPPRAALTLLPATTLPGLPVGFLLTISNPSAQPKVIADVARLNVTTAGGTVHAHGLRGEGTVHLPSDQLETCNITHCLSIPPNGQRQLYISFGPLLVENEFFVDRRLSGPGRYDLQMIVFVYRAS
jgi:hypothetical protein